MSRVAETKEGTYVVKTGYDGYRVAGPFERKIDALLAKEELPAPVVRASRRKGGEGGVFFLENEETGEQLLDGQKFRKPEDALRARAKHFPTVTTPPVSDDEPRPKGKRAATAD